MAQNRRTVGPGAKPSASALAPGVRVAGARYLLKRILGRGAFCEVWLAWDRTIEHDVALKFLPSTILTKPEWLAVLKTETHCSLKLTHPAITRVYDFIEHRDVAAIAMEYADGWSLGALRVDHPQKRFSCSEITPWLRQLCAALDYAHYEFGYAHGDIKPSNLLLNARDQFKVADFGIGHRLRKTVEPTDKSLQQRTQPYLSPQQLVGADLGLLDDVYGLGATIFDLLTGTTPFRGTDQSYQILNVRQPKLRHRLSELGIQDTIPEAWEETVRACLEKDPANRPQTVNQVLRRLRLEEDSLPILDAQTEPVLESLAPLLSMPGGPEEQRAQT